MNGDSCVIGVMECVGAVHDGRCSPWVMCSLVSGNQIHDSQDVC